MRIIYIHKDNVYRRPPVLNTLQIINDLGYDVSLITTGINEHWSDEFKKRGISFHVVTQDDKPSNFIKKMMNYRHFKKGVSDIVKKYEREDSVVLWIENASAIVALGDFINKYDHVLQIQELHNTRKYQMQAIGKVIGSAKAVVMPEYCRTQLYKVWFKLDKTPYILPNKPYSTLPDEDIERMLAKYPEVVEIAKKKKIVLYQGEINRVRMLDKIAKALRTMGDEYHLLLVGGEQNKGLVNELKSIFPGITHIKFIPAPDYQAFCKLAHIGFVSYLPISLNQIFCAPNKIFEYSSYGLPMIGNDIPGLRYSIGVAGAGKLVDMEKEEDIATAIKEIEKNYDRFRERAFRFYEDTDNVKTLKSILQSITGKQ